MPLCPHCSQDVPAANAQLHELRCSTARNSGPHGSQGPSEVAAIASSPPPPASTEQGAGAPPPPGEDGFAECPLCEEIVSSSSYEAHLAQCSVTQQHEAQSRGGRGGVPADYASRRGAAWVDCPPCFEKFPQDSIERHAATCAGGGGGSSGRPTTRPRSPDKRRRAFTRLRAIVHRSSNSSAEGDVAICVRQGDLTLEATDCIVNPANDKLMHGSGVAGALVRFGGDIIQDISDVIVAERGPIPVGEAVVTEAGRLQCKHIVHTVGPMWKGGKEGEVDLLALAVVSSLRAASALSCASIAIPAISSGLFGFPKVLSIDTILSAVAKFLFFWKAARRR